MNVQDSRRKCIDAVGGFDSGTDETDAAYGIERHIVVDEYNPFGGTRLAKPVPAGRDTDIFWRPDESYIGMAAQSLVEKRPLLRCAALVQNDDVRLGLFLQKA
jgi:hypothetical protein